MPQVAESDDLELLRSAVHDLADHLIASDANSPDHTGEVPTPALDALNEMGLLTPSDIDVGGQGIPSHLQWCVIGEELGKVDAGTAFDVLNGAYAAIIVDRCGTAAQRELLRAVRAVEGSTRGTLLYFEGFGRSTVELSTTLDTHDGKVGVSGRKNAVAHLADSRYGVVVGRQGAETAAAVLSSESLTSLRVVRDDTAAGKMGARSAPTAVVELVDAEAELLPRGGIELSKVIAGFRIAIAAIAIGVGEAAVQYAAAYAASREAFGQRIADFQGVSFPLVEASLKIDSARLLIADLAIALDGDTYPNRLDEQVSAAVAAAGQAGMAATVAAVNTLGGHGYLTDHPMERLYRDASVLAAVDFDPLLTDWSVT
ncbi:acyl-CoA dehydrogenase family protein [Mycolicibacterium sp. CH28]|uniref:acyl-CoA dehydrogenase family protein n=1 Tax=Mycolicibacterium sp. CH28 TaxID=2512237 RepID=UPI0013871E23|nr:acyl-CoA dehydrogenase family protein [Mycolicibacterium sp. CH28]